MSRKFSASFNLSIVDKPARHASGVDYARGWQSVEVDQAEFIACVKSGCAFSAQFKGEYRKGVNFERAGFIAADCDGTLTIEEALKLSFVCNNASFLYTTPSHTEETHRFRVVFLLESPITNGAVWADALLGLAVAVGSDTSIKDAARLFYGNTRAEVHDIGVTLSDAVVEQLRLRGEAKRQSRGSDGPWIAERALSNFELIKLASGDKVRVDQLVRGASLHCPYHDDGDPSAFAVVSYEGNIGIHCMACGGTSWPKATLDDYDFEAFDKLVDEVSETQASLPVTERPGLTRFFPPEPRVTRLQKEFLPVIGYEPGVVLVKSPKGSGKTDALISLVHCVKNKIFRPDIAIGDRPKSILLVGHRRMLLIEAAAKLDLYCYLDSITAPN